MPCSSTCWGWPAGEQLCRQGLEGPKGQHDPKSATCSCIKGIQQRPGLLWVGNRQRVGGGEPYLQLSSARETWTSQNESSKGPWCWLRSIQHMGRSWESWDCPVWNREGSGDLISVYTYLMKGTKKGRARGFSVVPSARTGDNAHKLKNKKIYLNIKGRQFFSCQGCRTLEQAAQRADGDHVGSI